MNVDFSGSVKRALFHVPKTKAIHDEWIEIDDSDRIAPLNTKQDPASKPKSSRKKAKKKDATVAPLAPSAGQNAGMNVPHNGGIANLVDTSRAQLLREMAAAAIASARGFPTEATSPVIGTGARLVGYPTTTTVHGDGTVSMQLVNRPPPSPIRSFAASGTQSSSPAKLVAGNASSTMRIPKKFSAQPVVSRQTTSYNIPRNQASSQEGGGSSVENVPTQAASYTIPRKAAQHGGDGTSSVERIPRKAPSSIANPDFNGASLLLGMTSSDVTRSLLAGTGSYFPPNRPDQSYQARAMQGQYPIPLPNQYFDARNYWQGGQQQGPPRQHYGGEPNKKQYDGRR